MADQPAAPERKAPPAPDFGAVLGGRPQGPRADISDPAPRLPTPEARTPEVRPAVPRPTEVARTPELPPPGDRPNLKFSGRALELSFSDRDFDKKLAFAARYNSKDFDTINLKDVPPGNKVKTWVDSSGYFLYLSDGSQRPAVKHYIPRNVDSLSLSPTDNLDMKAERGRINVAYDKDVSDQVSKFYKTELGGDFNINSRSIPNRDGGNASINYARNMSGIASEKLANMENVLREAAKTTGNPYSKMWLGDIYMAQGFQYVAQQALTDKPVPYNNPYTMRKLNDAIALEDAAVKDSDSIMGNQGFKRNYNAFNPLAPDSPYWDPRRNPTGFTDYFGGVGNQSQYRKECYSTIKGLIEANALPMPQLPPYRAPRRFQ